MGVSTVFVRLDDKTLNRWRADPGSFEIDKYPNCETIEVSILSMPVAELVNEVRKKKTGSRVNDPLYDVLNGMGGTADPSIFESDSPPRLMKVTEVASASRAMGEIGFDELRQVYDLDRLKESLLELEDIWDDLGPNVLEDHLMPEFEKIRGFFRRAAEHAQNVVMYWY